MNMPAEKNDERPLTPDLYFEMLNGHQSTAALKAAIDLDLFRAVGDGPGDVASLARQCSASERGIRILCDFLTIKGLLVKEDGRYRHSPTSATFLDPRSPASLAPTAQFILNPTMRESYDHLTEIVRTGRSSISLSIEVWAMRQGQGERLKVTDATFTFVAVDDEGRPRPL